MNVQWTKGCWAHPRERHQGSGLSWADKSNARMYIAKQGNQLPTDCVFRGITIFWLLKIPLPMLVIVLVPLPPGCVISIIRTSSTPLVYKTRWEHCFLKVVLRKTYNYTTSLILNSWPQMLLQSSNPEMSVTKITFQLLEMRPSLLLLFIQTAIYPLLFSSSHHFNLSWWPHFYHYYLVLLSLNPLYTLPFLLLLSCSSLRSALHPFPPLLSLTLLLQLPLLSSALNSFSHLDDSHSVCPLQTTPRQLLAQVISNLHCTKSIDCQLTRLLSWISTQLRYSLPTLGNTSFTC